MSPARVHNYLRGGAANFTPDREAAHQLLNRFPDAHTAIRHNLGFQQRTILYLAEQGIRQFLDLGSGIPTTGGLHDLVHTLAPDSTLVHVDTDELAEAIAEELFNDAKGTTFVKRDIREPDALLRDPRVHKDINLDEPVALLLMTTAGYLTDHDRPAELLDQYRHRISPGSYLALSHPSTESLDEAGEKSGLTHRSPDEITSWLSGFELVDPGIVHTEQWRCDDDVPPSNWVHLAAVARTTVR